ncbi:MAG: cache domain-containing protein [Opitutus sp.]|nr:cache domain-containing protein [Opitutus sp.]
MSTTPATVENPASNAATPERISALASLLRNRIRGSIQEISDINLQARVLSINAQIEAGRAGEAGRAFSVVAEEMVSFSDRTQRAAQKLEEQSEAVVMELAEVSHRLATEVRGTRLADLALTNIDLIDRNLYERSCDCRWWATDAAVVAALAQPTPTNLSFASQRLGVILKAYTVYFDIVIADANGVLVANGRPDTYPVVGTDCSQAPWFQSAIATRSGDEFGFQTVHVSPLVKDRRALVYSCRVCRGGDANGELLGVLGVVFNWDGLAQRIMHETPIEESKRSVTRTCIVDDAGNVLADSRDRILEERIELPDRSALFATKKSSQVITTSGRTLLVAHAQSPGFETYRTGWHSLIVEELTAQTDA